MRYIEYAATAPPPRRPVRALDVVWFNIPVFLGSLGVLTAAAVIDRLVELPDPIRVPFIGGIALVLWWTVATVTVSTWVFDLSGVTRWRWLPEFVGRRPSTWVNITTGFDDTTSALADVLGRAKWIAVDIFDHGKLHDGAIRRARASRPAVGTSLPAGSPLPIMSGTADACFSLMAAHELRDQSDRRALFGEAARIPRPGGRLILVEHLRSPINALVFGPGVAHFFARDEWMFAAESVDLRLVAERSLTPFVHAFAFDHAAHSSPSVALETIDRDDRPGPLESSVRPMGTARAAHALQTETFRRMTPQQRVAAAFEMSADMRVIAEAGIRSRHPEYSNAEVRSALLDILLGKELADKVRAHSIRG